MPKAIITLTTDFGEKDHFSAVLKGAIYKELSDVIIVDISHCVSPFNILEAAYIIQNAYRNFPKGTIHIIGIDSELNPENKHITVLLDGHYFICSDNGIMSMICSEVVAENIVELKIHDTIESEISSLDVFAKAACHLARGGALEVIGKPIKDIKQIKKILPFNKPQSNQIIGTVIYIDNYGNVVTNIKKSFFEEIRKGRDYEILARTYSFNLILNKYSDVVNFNVPQSKRHDEGKALVLFNSSGYLEIAMYRSNTATVGGASSLMGLNIMDTVTINFY